MVLILCEELSFTRVKNMYLYTYIILYIKLNIHVGYRRGENKTKCIYKKKKKKMCIEIKFALNEAKRKCLFRFVQ